MFFPFVLSSPLSYFFFNGCRYLSKNTGFMGTLSVPWQKAKRGGGEPATGSFPVYSSKQVTGARDWVGRQRSVGLQGAGKKEG